MKLSYLLKVIPAIIALSICSGYFKNYFYFGLYGIDVNYYISLDDVIKYFLENIIILSITTVTAYLLVKIFVKMMATPGEVIEEEGLSSDNSFKGQFKQRALISLFTKMSEIATVLAFTIFFYSMIIESFGTRVLYFGALLATLLYIVKKNFNGLLSSISSIFNEENPTKLVFAISLGLIFAITNFYGMLTSYRQYYQLSTIKEKRITSFSLGNKTFPAHSFEYYIGQTNTYIFTYSENGTAVAYPKSELKQISTDKNQNPEILRYLIDLVKSF